MFESYYILMPLSNATLCVQFICTNHSGHLFLLLDLDQTDLGSGLNQTNGVKLLYVIAGCFRYNTLLIHLRYIITV